MRTASANPPATSCGAPTCPSGGSLSDQRVKRAAALPLNFQPGTQWEYSPSTGFDTLGRIVEILSGMTLEQFFKTRILDPLGMHDTFFTVPDARAADVTVGYTNERTVWRGRRLRRPRRARNRPGPTSLARAA